MRLVVAGLGGDGRSTIVTSREVEPEIGSFGAGTDVLWATTEYPPEVPADLRIGSQHLHDHGLEGKSTGWLFARMAPAFEDHMHRTDTVDYITIVAGEVAFGVEDSDVTLGPGDTVVILGVAHRWRPGSDGCTISVVSMVLPHLEGEKSRALPFAHDR